MAFIVGTDVSFRVADWLPNSGFRRQCPSILLMSIYSPGTVITNPEFSRLRQVAVAFFVGTDVSFGAGNWLARVVGITAAMSSLAG